MHAGYNPGHPASHGCVRLPAGFAKKLYSVTDLGTPVLIGA
jgi:lipoprotein-anchoring transpeptidase ErfK/SrfK